MRSTHDHERAPSGLALLLAATLLPGCSSDVDGERPNVLFIVWDTVRADRLSLYGHERTTTPFLDDWAKGALVFDNTRSTGSSTVPSHGAMFTGLLPSEHGANNRNNHLDGRHWTLAEIFRGAGYGTYLFAANPHISTAENFAQGFDVEEHPWDEKYKERALAILLGKLNPADTSSELPEKLKQRKPRRWELKAAGELAEEGLLEFLAEREPGEPWFAFLNYMEAHRQFLPKEQLRRAVMTPAQVARSYAVDRSWIPMWSYTFGLREYTAEELEVMALTYEACLLELDEKLASLFGALEAGGHLENTIVVLTGDHGEHLGDHHMLDHQYSLYDGLIHVPLVLSFPGVVPGRELRPVQNYDVFPTLLELAGLEPPPGLDSRARSLLTPEADRRRIAEYPAGFKRPLEQVQDAYPDWDPSPYRRELKAWTSGELKLIWGENGRHELYDLAADPGEQTNLVESRAEDTQRLLGELDEFLRGLTPYAGEGRSSSLSPEQAELLQGLGYAGD